MNFWKYKVIIVLVFGLSLLFRVGMAEVADSLNLSTLSQGSGPNVWQLFWDDGYRQLMSHVRRDDPLPENLKFIVIASGAKTNTTEAFSLFILDLPRKKRMESQIEFDGELKGVLLSWARNDEGRRDDRPYFFPFVSKKLEMTKLLNALSDRVNGIPKEKIEDFRQAKEIRLIGKLPDAWQLVFWNSKCEGMVTYTRGNEREWCEFVTTNLTAFDEKNLLELLENSRSKRFNFIAAGNRRCVGVTNENEIIFDGTAKDYKDFERYYTALDNAIFRWKHDVRLFSDKYLATGLSDNEGWKEHFRQDPLIPWTFFVPSPP